MAHLSFTVSSLRSGQSFNATISSTIEGYFSTVVELRPDGTKVHCVLRDGNKTSIPPNDFYRNRRDYLSTFINDIKGQLELAQVDYVMSRQDHDWAGYMQANLLSWPEGYPDAVLDDMADY